jgi:hypothetical protein
VVRPVALMLAVLAGGCSGRPPATPRTDNGAEAVAKTFFEALVRSDWPAAYDVLDPDSRARTSRVTFADLAQAAMKHVGFKPTTVGVVISEKGDEATAVAVFRTGAKQFKDGTALRRTASGWGVVLRQNFGAEATKKR